MQAACTAVGARIDIEASERTRKGATPSELKSLGDEPAMMAELLEVGYNTK